MSNNIDSNPLVVVNLQNTQIAFNSKTDAQLRKAYWLFRVMNNAFVVRWGSKLGLLANSLRLPIGPIVRFTMFEQFCGGVTLKECETTTNHLYKYDALTILDYGAEAKESEKDFDKTMQETMRAIDSAAASGGKIPVISCKFTGLAPFVLLEKLHAGKPLSRKENETYERATARLDTICKYAEAKSVGVFIDAEESWIQQPIDDLAEEMMRRYNTQKVAVYNTYQMYRHDRLPYLKASFARAASGGYLLGAKLVRGAYMEKERARAAEKGYASPIQIDKAATDRDYNMAIRFVVDNHERIGSCAATHNGASSLLQLELMDAQNIPHNHAHLNFCQLYGMSDPLTFNLADAGFNAAKYVVYGAVNEVFPYLVRRAQENASITGDMSRELSFITQEMKRRGLL